MQRRIRNLQRWSLASWMGRSIIGLLTDQNGDMNGDISLPVNAHAREKMSTFRNGKPGGAEMCL